jgi:hypothetical protein
MKLSKPDRASISSSMPANDPKMLLEFRTALPATPERVANTARMIARALDASDPDLQDGSVTMIVRNLDMRIAVRAHKPVGRRAVREVLAVISAPMPTVQKRPLTKHIAESLAKESGAVAEMGLEVFIPRQTQPVCKIDTDFFNAMEAAAKHVVPDRDIARGTTEAYARVLMIGRKDEGRGLMVRVRVGGQARDISVAENLTTSALTLLFDAARDERLVRLAIDVTWLRDADGTWGIDKRRALITGAGSFEAASGAEFADAALLAIEPRSDDEIAKILSDLETR